MIKLFSEVPDNNIFTINGMQYTKVAAVKISCCKSINAIKVDNDHQRIFIQPATEVEVNDQL